jgi:hypothetical protein
VIEFQRATRPLLGMLTSLEAGFDKYKVDLELQRSLRDVHDHAIRIVERADSFRALLQNALTVQTTLVGQQQNDEMRSLTEASLAQNEEVKKISAWAAILFAPDTRRDDLRHELRSHARAALAVRVPARSRADARHLRDPLPGLQATQLAVGPSPQGECRRRR